MKKIKEGLEESRSLLWWLALIVGGVWLFMLIVVSVFPEKLVCLWFWLIYSISLVSFVYVKEGARGKQGKYKKKTGEIFLVMWWSAYIIMALLDFLKIIPGGLCIPNEFPATCAEVMIIYAYSAKSKIRFLCREANADEKN